MTKLTSIIPIGNEQNNIVEAIQSVRFSVEIMVLDSFSKDDTVKLASIFKKSESPRRRNKQLASVVIFPLLAFCDTSVYEAIAGSLEITDRPVFQINF